MDSIEVDLQYAEEPDLYAPGAYWNADVAEEHYYLSVPVNNFGPVETEWLLQATS